MSRRITTISATLLTAVTPCAAQSASLLPQNLSERFISCPVETKSRTGHFNSNPHHYLSAADVNFELPGWEERVAADWQALTDLLPQELDAVVIDVRRVGGVPHYLYLSDGSQLEVRDPAGSAHFMAISAAMARARTESGGRVGGDARIGDLSIASLVTAVHGGALPIGATPDGIATYFAQVAGFDFLDALLHERWLLLPDAGEFRGGFGGTFTETTKNWTTDDASTRMGRIRAGHSGVLQLSGLAQAEWLKRLTQHDTDPVTRLPGFGGTMSAIDVQNVLYGDGTGMLTTPTLPLLQAIAPDAARAKALLDEGTGGRWRTFLAQGDGAAGLVTATYSCLPHLDGGREFIIVTHARGSERADTTAAAFRALIPLLVPSLATPPE